MSVFKSTVTDSAISVDDRAAVTVAYESAAGSKQHQQSQTFPLDLHYSEDEDTATDTGRTFSTLAEPVTPDFQPEEDREESPIALFKSILKDAQSNSRVSEFQNTYFMDGGHRFISLPTLGGSSKAAAHISRIFEDWLQAKLYHQNTTTNLYQDTTASCTTAMMDERLPILEDSVELVAEDIVNRLKSRSSVRGMAGLSRIWMKIRTGHVYTYHQSSDDGQQPLMITADMEDFFQQFPLFVEIIIYAMPRDFHHTFDDNIELLLSLENITINPSEPYYIKESIPLIV